MSESKPLPNPYGGLHVLLDKFEAEGLDISPVADVVLLFAMIHGRGREAFAALRASGWTMPQPPTPEKSQQEQVKVLLGRLLGLLPLPDGYQYEVELKLLPNPLISALEATNPEGMAYVRRRLDRLLFRLSQRSGQTIESLPLSSSGSRRG